MFRKLFPVVVIGLWGIVALPLPERANATTPLTRAVIKNLRNLVQLMPQNQQTRRARKSDAMIPGDGLSTGRASLADLRFNDGSLARVGEQAVFRFLPKTRNFSLSNGTVLLLIPPGQGRTRINTPNAAAAIRGSALFVRYDEKKDTTVVAALTNSGIVVSNKDGSQSRELRAGELLVIVRGKFQSLYEFDLRTFYDTSDLVRGLDLPRRIEHHPDPAIAKVQAETSQAANSQKPVTGQTVVENPSFVQLTGNPSNSPTNNTDVKDNASVDTLQETGQVVSDTQQQNDHKNTDTPKEPANNNSGNTTNNSSTPETPGQQPGAGGSTSPNPSDNNQQPTPETPGQQPGGSTSPNPSDNNQQPTPETPGQQPGGSTSPNPSDNNQQPTPETPGQQPGGSTSPNPSDNNQQPTPETPGQQPGGSTNPNPSDNNQQPQPNNPGQQPGGSTSPNPDPGNNNIDSGGQSSPDTIPST